MNYKQAQAILSDFLMKCESEGVALPDDPLSAVIAAIRALDHEAKHEVGRPQMEAAMAHMRQEFGVVKTATSTDKENVKKPRIATKTEQGSPRSSAKAEGAAAISPTPARQRQRQGQGKLQEQIRASPAKQSENQALVDQLLQLGEFELKSGHAQRGVARLRAAKELRDANEVITSGAQARKLDHVGASSAGMIDVILNQGIQGALKDYEKE